MLDMKLIHIICGKIILRKIQEHEKLYKDDFKVIEILLKEYLEMMKK